MAERKQKAPLAVAQRQFLRAGIDNLRPLHVPGQPDSLEKGFSLHFTDDSVLTAEFTTEGPLAITVDLRSPQVQSLTQRRRHPSAHPVTIPLEGTPSRLSRNEKRLLEYARQAITFLEAGETEVEKVPENLKRAGQLLDAMRETNRRTRAS